MEGIEKGYTEAFKSFLDKKFRDAGGGTGGIDLRLFTNGDGIVHGNYKGHNFQGYFTTDTRNFPHFHFSVEGLNLCIIERKPKDLTRLIGAPCYESDNALSFPVKRAVGNIKNAGDVISDLWENALKHIFGAMQRS